MKKSKEAPADTVSVQRHELEEIAARLKEKAATMSQPHLIEDEAVKLFAIASRGLGEADEQPEEE